MVIKQVTVGKEFKRGLPNFSNITASCYLVVEVAEGEKVDWDTLWDEVNRQVNSQTEGLDPNWIKTGETKNFFITKIKSPKRSQE